MSSAGFAGLERIISLVRNRRDLGSKTVRVGLEMGTI